MKGKLETFKDNKKDFVSDKGKAKASTDRSRDIECFKCLGRGHIVNQCPNRNVMILKYNREIETESETNDDMPPLEDVSEVEYPIEGELLVTK